MKTTHFLILVLLFGAGSCNRSQKCDDRDGYEYYDIPLATKPFILNKKGEILVFANSKNDTVEFLCTDESRDYKLVYNKNQGSSDCPIIVKKYEESYDYNYLGDTALFGFMRIKYQRSYLSSKLLTDFDINISDSIYCNATLDYFLSENLTDSIFYSGQYFSGTYSPSKNLLFNKELGIIKFIDKQNEPWQIIQKK